MTNVKLTGKQLEGLIEFLESDEVGDLTPLEEAKRVWEYCAELYESRAKFIVVGQQFKDEDGKPVPHVTARKFALSFFSTKGDAQTAALALTYPTSAATGEAYQTWTLPVEHVTASKFYQARKKRIEGLAEARERKAFREGCERRVEADIKQYAHVPGYEDWRREQHRQMFEED